MTWSGPQDLAWLCRSGRSEFTGAREGRKAGSLIDWKKWKGMESWKTVAGSRGRALPVRLFSHFEWQLEAGTEK